MLKFPINFGISNRYSEIQLNDDWTILCDCFLSDDLKLNVAVQRHRKVTSEDVLIAGKLCVSNFNALKSEVPSEFNKFMNNSDSVHLVQLSISQKISNTSVYTNEFCTLRGVIFIASTGDKCNCGWQSGGSKKCIKPKSLVQLSNDFERLLDPETSCFADVKLICGNVSIPAHKVFLSSRSPVFDAMFRSPMKESRENEVCITDIDAPVLRTMLIYIYTGKVSELTITSATDLLVAADKYMIQDLKDICCDFLKENATFQHVLTALVKDDTCMKTFAMDYISNKSTNFSLIVHTEEWKALKNQNPALAIEILECFVKSEG